MSVVRRAPAVLALTFMVALVVALGWAWLAGWRLNVVESESMAPLLHRNSLAIVAPEYGGHVRRGDVIAFRNGQNIGAQIVHRVVRVLEQNGERFYETKGDANPTPDRRLVPASDVHGRLIFQLAHVGGIGRALAFPRNVLLFVGTPLLALLVSELRFRRGRAVEGVCPTCGVVPARIAPQRSARSVPIGWPTPTIARGQ